MSSPFADFEARMRAKDWVDAARALAAVEADPKQVGDALQRLERESPRQWLPEVIAGLLSSARSAACQTALVETGRWPRWRAVLPHQLACTVLTLCHPPDGGLACDVCHKRFMPREGAIGPVAELCHRCIQLKRHRPRSSCLACRRPSRWSFCGICEPQIDALMLRRKALVTEAARGS